MPATYATPRQPGNQFPDLTEVSASPGGFVLFAPLAIDGDDSRVDVGDDLPVNVVGMYPTFASEREFIAEHGLEAFWKLD